MYGRLQGAAQSCAPMAISNAVKTMGLLLGRA
jgi:hypothetical protein